MNSIDRIDEYAELINSGLSDDGCGRESEEVFDVKTMLELIAATAARLAEIYSTAYQELAQ